MTRRTLAFALALSAVSGSALAQAHVPGTPGAFALGVSAGPSTFAQDSVAMHGFGGAVTAEATIGPTWFVRAQYGATPRHRLTLGMAHAVTLPGPRTFLSGEGGLATVGPKHGVYGGGGLQAPFGDSRFLFTADVRVYITNVDLGVAFYAGVKLRIA